ncbi:MAG: hypothetical protein M3290_05380 [Actinomycetota bacterium]|nr:hypothetical protein [Actinomycetota bacterium]
MAAAVVIVGICAPHASARGFGTNPLATVKQEADAAKCGNLTMNMLAAIMIAPTYGETGTGSTGTPSPMAMSRGDIDQDLYSFNTTATEERAYWHPGVGMWQEDDVGLGSQMTANQRVAVQTSAHKAATTMASRYCSVSGTNAEKRAYAWGLWNACNSGACESVYNEVYCGGSDSICDSLNRNDSVGGWGGMQSNTCRFGGDASTSFNCWYLDITNAQGDTSYWKKDPKTGGTSISPLTFSMYSWADSGKEIRDWVKDDTSYGREIRANRTFPNNSRNGLDWKEPTAKLCDTTTRRGICS